MAASLDAMARAFNRLERRPAVFDRPIREAAGLWRAPRAVPVDDVVGAFAAHGGFTVDGERVYLPVHEADAAELTGEYLIYCPDQPVTCVAYYDYAAGELRRIPYEAFGETYPAWRLRFWHPAFDPPAEPTFVRAAGGAASTGAEAAGTARAGADAGRETDPDGGDAGAPGSTRTATERASASAGSDARDADAAADAARGESAPTADAAAPAPSSEGSTASAGADPAAADRTGIEPLAVDPDSPFEALRSFVQREREAERESARAQFARLDVDRYAEQAGAIPALVPAGHHVDAYGQQTVHLRLPADGDGRGSTDGGTVEGAAAGAAIGGTDDAGDGGAVDIPERYGIYPGMEVLIDSHAGAEEFPVEAEVLAVEGRRLEASVYWTRTAASGRPEAAFEPDSGERFAVGELLNPVPTDRQLDAIASVEDDDRKAALLTGARTPAYASALDVSVPKAGLNTRQYRAAQDALRAADVHCIHGPPGTGKTRTLVRVIRAACDAGLRVLACAHSNQAVDNLLVGDSTADRADPRSLHGLAREGDLSVARAGTNSDSDLVAAEYEGESVWTADVVCATTSGAHQFGDDVFDLAVVDEATQSSVPSSLLPFAKAERTVLAGDHRQLPPYHASETHDEEAIEVSLFEHVLARHGDDVSTGLRTQYRMHEAIAAFPNAEFYGGRLRCGDRNRDWTIGSLPPLEAIHVEGEERETPGHSYRNEAEAKAVGRQVSRLLHAGVNPGDIGVITAYSGQVGAVRKRLLELHDREAVAGIEIATVDAFQGSEREAVVVSFVRSNPQGYSGFLTFPAEGPRRLNVALTRARKRCVLVGNFETLRTRAPDRTPAESAADVYERLYQHLREADVLGEPSWEDPQT